MSKYTLVVTDTGNNIGDLSVESLSLGVLQGSGPKGAGWTGVSYSSATGRFTFTSNDGLGYVSEDITADLDAAVAAAQAAQAATEVIYDQFGDQYLGPKASDPTTDNDGDPLTQGDVYWNTTDSVLKFYSGAAWVAPEAIASTAAANALASETAAAASASNAASSESSASSSAASAAASAASAAASLDSFDDRYLGSKTSAPSVDNDGNALLEGALYWNATSNILYVWDGSSWQNMGSFQYGGTASIDDGSESNPSLRFANDLDTGIYRSGDNSFSFATNGQEAATFEYAGATAFQLLSSTGDELLNVDETTDDLLQVINTDDEVLFSVSNTSGVAINKDTTVTGSVTASQINSDGAIIAAGAGQFGDDVNVTGTVTADGLTVDGDLTINDTNVTLDLMESDTTDLNTRLQSQNSGFAIKTLNDAKSAQTPRFLLNHATGDISFYEDTGTTPKFFWDASAEALGIGTTSLTADLQIGANPGSDRTFQMGSAGATRFVVSTDGVNGLTNIGCTNDSTTGRLAFRTGASLTERMRIDESGNVLVSTTTNSNSTAGINLRATNEIAAVRSGANPLYLNRLVSDGSIAIFAKNGTTVGSIGAEYSTLNIDGGSGAAGIHFAAASLTPRDNGTYADAGVDLGTASYRFRNLYLSGGVYLGGTGAANHLDDYEEGTWTPVYKGATTAGSYAYNEQQGHYIKIGRQVTAWFNMTNITDVSAGTGDAVIGGFPFAGSWQAGFNAEGLGTIILNGWNNVNGDTANCQLASGTDLYLYRQSGATNATAAVLVTEKSSNGSDLRGFITYQTA